MATPAAKGLSGRGVSAPRGKESRRRRQEFQPANIREAALRRKPAKRQRKSEPAQFRAFLSSGVICSRARLPSVEHDNFHTLFLVSLSPAKKKARPGMFLNSGTGHGMDPNGQDAAFVNPGKPMKNPTAHLQN